MNSPYKRFECHGYIPVAADRDVRIEVYLHAETQEDALCAAMRLHPVIPREGWYAWPNPEDQS